MIPVSVIIATKNEAAHIERCLAALSRFAEVIVVDSESADNTAALAAKAGARVVSFRWDGAYPKKRQWCLDTLPLCHDWVFFVDADEIVTENLAREIEDLFQKPPACAGYFIKGQYAIGGKKLRFGLRNNKLCLIDRTKMAFPEIDDLDIPGMGEMEGHYQPVLKPGERGTIGHIQSPLLHETCAPESPEWRARHERYAAWERGMNAKNAWPRDPVPFRQTLKTLFRAMPGRALAAFAHCYILKAGFMDGLAGFDFAASRYRYYRMIAASAASKAPAQDAAA